MFLITVEHFMIISTTPAIFANETRSLKSSSETWVTRCPVTIYFEYSGKWNEGVIGCSKEGECHHLKFGGLDWTFIANFTGGFRNQGNAGVFNGYFWVFGGRGTKIQPLEYFFAR